MTHKRLDRRLCRSVFIECFGTCVLIVSLIVLLVPTGVEAEATRVLEWYEVEKPGKTGNLVIHPSDINQIAVSTENVIYALDRSNSRLYRSKNGGTTWTDITTGITGSADNLSQIAVAPDKPGILAFVANSGQDVYLSIDGGDSWYDTKLPAISGAIQCIALSYGYIEYGSDDLTWSIAVGTADWGDATTTGQVWATSVQSGISAWKNLSITATTDSTITNAEVSAVAFSPNYKNDGVILAIGSTASDVTPSNSTYLCIYQRDLSDAVKWNKFSNFPVQIASEGDDASVKQIISALVLPSDYYGANLSNMVTFLSYNRRSDPLQESNNDVYRVNSNAYPVITRLNAGTVTGNTFANISSLSFNGTIYTGAAGVASGRLLAGDYGTNESYPYDSGWPFVQVRRCFNPFDTSVTWQKATQPPTGPGSAQVAWNSGGTTAYCGTGSIPDYVPPDPDESGFSRSADYGDTWEQVSLIDTEIRICDIALAPDSKTLFLATYSELGYEWVWRSAGDPIGESWGRILGMDADSNRIIIRLSPDYSSDYTLVAAEKDGGHAYAISHDRGNHWHEYQMPAPMIDMILTDQNTVLVALEGGLMRKTSNDGAVWQFPVMMNVEEVNMLSLASNGDIFVGSRDGRIAYSTDDATSFAQISQPVPRNTGDVQVIPDSGYVQNRTILAATDISDKGIYRMVLGSSTGWELIDLTVLDLQAGEEFSGLAMGVEGTLYALRKEPVNGTGSGGMNRSLNPDEEHTLEIEWDVVNVTLPAGVTFDPEITLYNHTLCFLKISGNASQNELWSVDTHDVNDYAIYRFIDNICKEGTWIDQAGEVGCDPVSGRNQGFDLKWEQLSLSDEYEINISKDDIFSMTLGSVEPSSNPFYAPFSVVSPTFVVQAGGSLDCGHGYFWRVRTRHAVTGEYIRSPWSETGDFIVKAGFAVLASSLGPQLLAPDPGCTRSCNAAVNFSWTPMKEAEAYLFQLSENPDMSSPLVSVNIKGTTAYEYTGKLKCATSYFWRVMSIEPAESEWSSIFSFVTGEIAVLQPTVEQATEQVATPAIPVWVRAVIAGGIAIIVLLLVLVIWWRPLR